MYTVDLNTSDRRGPCSSQPQATLLGKYQVLDCLEIFSTQVSLLSSDSLKTTILYPGDFAEIGSLCTFDVAFQRRNSGTVMKFKLPQRECQEWHVQSISIIVGYFSARNSFAFSVYFMYIFCVCFCQKYYSLALRMAHIQ